MKKFIRKCLLFCLILTGLLGGISSFILFGLPQQFNKTYQHALYLQVRALSHIRSPKIVVMGDSSVPFSLDAAQMSRMMKQPVQTLGIHSGTSIQYILNLSKARVQRGDTMVLELVPDTEDSFSPSIVLTACENHFDMYRSFTWDDWDKVIRYYPTYLLKKVKYCCHIRDQEAPSYSIRAFDRKGNYIYFRSSCLPRPRLKFGDRDTIFKRKDYDENMIAFLNDYSLYCKQKGATFLISFPPFLNDSVAPGSDSINDVQKYLASQLKAPIITNLAKRSLPRRYFYNNDSHCNTAGAERVTKDLTNEILAYRHSKNHSLKVLGQAPQTVKLARH